ncbi:MAG: hypothetical protein WAU91_23410 [Desulfatitalea sp.]
MTVVLAMPYSSCTGFCFKVKNLSAPLRRFILGLGSNWYAKIKLLMKMVSCNIQRDTGADGAEAHIQALPFEIIIIIISARRWSRLYLFGYACMLRGER